MGAHKSAARADRLRRVEVLAANTAPPIRATFRPHVRADDDIEALILEAKQSAIDRVWAEHLADEEIVETGIIRRPGSAP